jgi:dolichol-phosphate mannosyltransferase
MKPAAGPSEGPGVIFGQYARFCVVGGSGVVVDMLVLHALASPHGLGWNLTVSKAIAAEVALFTNFLLNDGWTFRSTDRLRPARPPWLGRLARFNLICTAGIGLSVALLNVQVRFLGLNLYVANFVAIVVASLWNFVMVRRYGWRVGSRTEPPSQPARPASGELG